MRKQVYSALFGLLSMAAVAQTTENKTVSPFRILELQGAPNVEITSFDSLYCTVTGSQNDINNIVLKQEDNKLIINTTGVITGEVKVKLGCKGLETVIADGASRLSSDVIYKTENFSATTNGASGTKLMIEAKTVVVESDGASSIRLKGKCDSLSIKADGVSKVKAYYLQSRGAHVKTDGTAKVFVSATQNLHVNSDGVSRVYYGGNPVNKVFEKRGISGVEEYSDGNEPEEWHSRNWSWNYQGGFKHWMGVGLTFNGYTMKDYQTTMDSANAYMDLNYGRSIGWDLNIIQHNFHIFRNYVNLCTGIGLQFNRYQFRNKVTLNPDSSYVTGAIMPDNNYRKNVLKAAYLNVPLFLEFNTSKRPSRSFHIGAGAVAGVKIGSRTKQYYNNDGYNHFVYRKDDYNLNPFKLQAMATIGYGWLTFYGTYNITTMFENNKGPELYPFTIGLRIIPFDGD